MNNLYLHSRSQLYETAKFSALIFIQKFYFIFMKFGMMPQSVGMFNLMLFFFSFFLSFFLLFLFYFVLFCLFICLFGGGFGFVVFVCVRVCFVFCFFFFRGGGGKGALCFVMISIRGRELYLGDFIKNVYNTRLHLDT